MENKKKKKKNFFFKLGIFCLELGKKHTFWHWEWGRISAPKSGDREPCFFHPLVLQGERVKNNFTPLISVRIYPNIFKKKKAIKIDLVGQQKAKEIQYTQYNQVVMGKLLMDFITLPSAVQFYLRVVKCTQPIDWFSALIIQYDLRKQSQFQATCCVHSSNCLFHLTFYVPQCFCKTRIFGGH